MTRRAALITSNYWPEQTGISRTSTELAEFLAARGQRVRVATAMPYYPAWRIFPGYRGRLLRRERQNDVEILRAWHYVRPAPSTLGRMLHEITIGLMAIPNILRAVLSADDVYVVTPTQTLAFVGVLVTRLLGKRPIVVVMDIMPDAAVELGLVTNRRMIALSAWMSRVCYRAAREIHTLGEGMARRIARNGAERSRIRVVPVTIDVNELRPPAAPNEFRSRYVPSGRFAVLHSGNMGKKQDLDLVLDTADRMRGDARVHFYVFGDGAMRDAFVARRAAMRLANVSHHPLEERRLLPHMLHGADVVLISQLAEVTDIAVPSKLITAMAAGAMIVAACADDSETARIVRESGGGVVIPPSDPAALAGALTAIADNPASYAHHRDRARAYAAREFDRQRVYGALVAS